MMEVEDINGIPTHVFSLTSAAEGGRTRPLVVVVPGSPGMTHFYVPFARRLFHLAGARLDVHVVAHAGHSPGFLRDGQTPDGPSDEATSSHPEGAEPRDWFNLEEQIAHKLAFVARCTPAGRDLYLVGHSIGCHMVLAMLGRLPPAAVKRAVLLFPTIERMGDTPNGRKLTPLFSGRYRWALTSLVALLSWCPEWLKVLLLRRYFHTTPRAHVEDMVRAVVNIDGCSMHNILCMAGQEMAEVREAPEELLHRHIDRLAFYYGTGDRWTLPSCYQDMAARFPDRDVNLCTQGHPHAFVETASDEMADFVLSRLTLNCDDS